MHFAKRAVLGALLPLFATALAGCSSSSQDKAAAPPAPQVTVANPVTQDVIDWDEYVGRFEAISNVDVKPRATGYLQAVHFIDGQYVRRGQLLFSIDPRTAQAALAQAQAQLVKAQASLVNARTELARSHILAASQAASTEEVESRQAAVRAGAADVAAGQAAVRTQQLAVGFTRVLAPISGRISERRVDPGNAVTADQTILTTIVSTDPLHFSFQGSEALLLKYQRGHSGDRTGTPVRIRLQDEADYVHAGRLDFVDNVVDAGGGTIHARAIVPNPDAFLKPGMFGHMRLAGSSPYRAVLVPDGAIVTDAARRVVYVVDRAGTVASRPVELGPLTGNLRVVRSGVSPNDRVIIDGIQRARPGQKVQARPGNIRFVPGPEADSTPALTPPSAIATPVRGAAR
ncbi:MAG: efflux transporter periplasmic adaptor subunit [Alphaproteobacteria bacterium]|nr:efflux transporter periplasmic adaptor subunit [Alphaproteobacteria bacterium]